MFLLLCYVCAALPLGCNQVKDQDQRTPPQSAEPTQLAGPNQTVAAGRSDPWNGSSAATVAAAHNGRDAGIGSPDPDGAAGNAIAIALPNTNKKSPSTALRCAIEGAPLSAEHVLSLAMSNDGHLYISDDLGFRRYQPTFEGGCKLKLDRAYGRNGLLAAPPDQPTSQSLEGPVVLRSGGPTWRLTSDGKKAIYAFDFLLGVYRIDGNRTTAVCPNLKGIDSLVTVGGITYVGGGQVQRVNLRSKCSTSDGKAGQGTLYSVADQLWFKSNQDSKTLVALDASGQRTAVQIKSTNSFAPGGFCFASAVTRCSDKICVVDNNCKKIEIYNHDGSFAAELNDRLFDRVPYGLPTGTSAGAAGLWLAATYHEGDTYEGAVFLVPATEI
ncbi:MAG: hypothetical protein KBG15_19200 [Kofleriaceae bacterium]|nr:hypothetical protein [Kofleriaceae bacterium]